MPRGVLRPVPLRIVQVVGARPNFVKMAPVIDALEGHAGIEQLIVHTGQHYDARMSAEMFDDLQLPKPDVFLGVGSASHGAQTARALEALERVLADHAADLVCVGGDVNSTLAAALAASKLGIPVAHVEAGLRSFDWTMPEEINRVLTDRLSTWLFTHSPEAAPNLLGEGIRERPGALRRQHDDRLAAAVRGGRASPAELGDAGTAPARLRPGDAAPAVQRRRAGQLDRIVDGLLALARHTAVVFPIHPRTRARLAANGRRAELDRAGILSLEPVGYLSFLSLELGAGAVVTDSGGVQEETSALGVPCFTLRLNTERPITITHGTNTLLGEDASKLGDIRPQSGATTPADIPLWDGKTGDRIARILLAARP